MRLCWTTSFTDYTTPLLPEINSDIVNLSYTRYDISDGKTQHHDVSSRYRTSQGYVRRRSGYRVSVLKKGNQDLSNKKPVLPKIWRIYQYSINPPIRPLVIRIANYPGRLGPSGQFVENSTKLTCLEITGYRTK